MPQYGRRFYSKAQKPLPLKGGLAMLERAKQDVKGAGGVSGLAAVVVGANAMVLPLNVAAEALGTRLGGAITKKLSKEIFSSFKWDGVKDADREEDGDKGDDDAKGAKPGNGAKAGNGAKPGGASANGAKANGSKGNGAGPSGGKGGAGKPGGKDAKDAKDDGKDGDKKPKRVGSRWKGLLGASKRELMQAAKGKGAGNLVPSLGMMVGLIQDTLEMFEEAQEAGGDESATGKLIQQLDQNMATMKRHMMKLKAVAGGE